MKEREKILSYFRSIESRVGYSYLLWDSKHFGYYPKNIRNVSEKEAQIFYMERVAESLDLKPGLKVLDAGCGRGIVASYLANRYNVNVVGIDFDEHEILKARAQDFKKAKSRRVEFSVADFSNTSFASDSFDRIYTNETLSHAPDVSKVLREFHRLIKPGGKLSLFEYTLNEENTFSDRKKGIRDFVIAESGMFGLKQFRHEEFCNVLESAGFSNVRGINISENVEPSFSRLIRIGKRWQRLIKFIKLEKYFVNAFAAANFLPFIFEDLVRYYVFTAKK